MKRWMLGAALLAALSMLAPTSGSAQDGVPKGRIVFARRVQKGEDTTSKIFSIRPDGSDRARLTDGPMDESPEWSPGHDLIAFTRRTREDLGPTSTEQTSLYVVDEGGGNLTLIENDVSDFEWSPDGGRLAYSYSGDVWTSAPDGSDKKQLTDDINHEFQIDWAPDGTKLVFTRSFDIYTVDADGGQSEPVVMTVDEEEEYPVWSPDGTTIVYTSTEGHYRNDEGFTYSNDLWLVSPDGSNVRQLTDDCHWDWWMSWLPDSQSLVYGTADDDDGCFEPKDDEIRRIDLEGNDTNLTKNKGGDYAPSLSPNARWVVYQGHGTRSKTGDADLFIMNLGSGRVLRLMDSASNVWEYSPDW